MSAIKRNCQNCKEICDIFHSLTDDELQIIENNRYNVSFKPGETIIKQHAAISHIVSFNQGLAKAYIEEVNKQDLILTIVKPTVLIATPGAYTDKFFHFSLKAITASTVCFIELEAFKSVIRKNPVFAEQFISYISQMAIQNYEKFVWLAQKQIHGRVAEALLFLSERIFASNHFDMLLSRQELADFIATTKESVCRVLKEFKDEGLIETKNNHVKILDYDGLRIISHRG